MRLFLFLLLISPTLFAQIDTGNGAIANCTDADIVNGGNIQCGDLNISAGFPGFNSPIPAVDIRVQGDVTIDGVLNLDGQPGPPDAQVFDDLFGAAGPGGGDGGRSGSGIPFPGAGSSGGKEGDDGAVCGAGGGGGGFSTAGLSSGTNCGVAVGGLLGPSYNSIFTSTLRGGFGGGCGGNGPLGVVGTGGGGGGAIHIRVGGNVIINGDITAIGGPGGNNTSDGGAGGAGSGGLIWIQALGNITNNGNINADGGAGGTAAASGNGGNGGTGAVKFEDIDGVIDGIGTLPSYAVTAIIPTGGPTLKSDISCGSIASKKDSDTQTFLIQLSFGFFLIWGFSFIGRRLKIFA